MISRRSLLAGLGFGPFVASLPRPLRAASSTNTRLTYGWDPAVEGPTEATYIVAPGGDDTADGTLAAPLRTIQAGVNRLATQNGGSLAIRGGLYREALHLDGLKGSAEAPFKIHRYGRERVTISAAELLTGWQPCTPADAETLGAPVEGVFVVRIPRRTLLHDAPLALNMFEQGEWLSIATDRADMAGLDSASDYARFFQAHPQLGPNDKLLGFTDPNLRGRTVAQMTGVRVLIHHAPNIVTPDPIAGYDPVNGTIELARKNRKVQREKNQPILRYSLQNVSTALAPGRWIIRDEPGDMLAIYLVPKDVGNLASGIEISVRETCVDIGPAANVELFGLEMLRAAGDGQHGGVGLRHIGGQQSPADNRGLRLIHCRVADTLSTAARGEGALFMRGVSGLTMQNVSVDHVRGAFGMFLNDCRDLDLRFLHLSQISQSPARFFGLRQAVFAFSLIEDSAWEAHANKFNFYQGSDAILVYGIRTRNTGGYATYQEASRIFYGFCEFDASAGGTDNRALASQNRQAGAGQGGEDGSGDPVVGATFWYWNLNLSPVPHANAPAKALTLGPPGNSQRHAYHNCVLYGGGYADIYLKNKDPSYEQRSYNHYTGLAYWQSKQNGWALAEGEAVISPGQQQRSKGLDMRATIAAEIAPLFPAFTDWDRDIDFNLVDWNAPPIGAQTY
jgi:hypothetical protein